ncbi:MAG TPA: adenylosuccinate synthase [bacterium]|nr:adenylosuccinate synthase [bacterium]
MPADVILGAQWGDEGKGKIVDVLAEKYDVIIRYQGGSNAGHTVIDGDKKYILHLLPSGIINSGKMNIISHGVVIDLNALAAEIKELKSKGVKVTPQNLMISSNAAVVLPYHKAIDAARESGNAPNKIGTTGRGIGPAYMDKYSRGGVRIRDLFNAEVLRKKITDNLAEKNFLLEKFYGKEKLRRGAILKELQKHARFIKPFVKDTVDEINKYVKNGKKILFEGAQGALLDIDFGTFPFVTSSNPTIGGVMTGSGISHSRIKGVWGITKAYQTRVGNGPMPTEMKEPEHSRTREAGGEYGATTGRPRRCGWLDLVALKYVCELNGITNIILTKIDVLSIFGRIKAATHYIYKGKKISTFVADGNELLKCRPVYKVLKGWGSDVSSARTYTALPKEARDYIRFIEKYTGVKVSVVSVGPDREQILKKP